MGHMTLSVTKTLVTKVDFVKYAVFHSKSCMKLIRNVILC